MVIILKTVSHFYAIKLHKS